MKSRSTSRGALRSKSLAQALALSTALLLCVAPAAVFAAPQTYAFSTSGPATLGLSSGTGVDASALAVQAALNANPLVTGTFVYDSSAAFSGSGTGGASTYGNAAGAPGFTALTGSGAGFSIMDPRGFITVGNNTLPGGLDQIQYFADSALKSSTVHNFVAFDIAGVQIVNLRFNWVGNFLSDQNLPGTPPSFNGILSFDIIAAPGSTSGLISDEFVSLNARVAAVPEPQTWALLLAGLALMGVARRRKSDRA